MQQPHQSAGHAHHGDGGLGGLGDVQQVVEQSLVLVVGEQVKLVQDEQDRTAAAAIAWPETRKPPKVNRRSWEKVNAHKPESLKRRFPQASLRTTDCWSLSLTFVSSSSDFPEF